MKPWALITGASQGIGLELARLFAADGFNLVLTARDRPRLAQLADELTARHGVMIKVVPGDLAKAATPKEIYDELQREKIPVFALVNNAGFGTQGAFAERELQIELDLMQVNMTALVELTRRFLPDMLARKEGRILNVASVAAFQPGPYMALYYASKAFVYSFSTALAVELENTGVTATTLCPGLTRSEFHTRANLKRTEGFLMMSAEEVAKIGYRAMMRGKAIVITGGLNRFGASVSKALPTRWTSRVAGKLNAPERERKS